MQTDSYPVRDLTCNQSISVAFVLVQAASVPRNVPTTLERVVLEKQYL